MTSRRTFLRMVGSIAAGVGLFLISDGLVSTQSLRKTDEDLTGFGFQIDASNSRASLITVKAYYTMMAQYTDLSEEDFVLQPPATVQDLINTCVLRHPSFVQMTGAMIMLLDGVPSQPTALLRDGDTVQFIPLTAGG